MNSTDDSRRGAPEAGPGSAPAADPPAAHGGVLPPVGRTVLPASGAPAPPKVVATPLAIGALIARNLVSIIGIVFFGWSASIVILLCFADTLLAMAVLIFGMITKFVDEEGSTTIGGRAQAWASGLFAAAFITAFMAIPLGVPLGIFVFGVQKAKFAEVLADPGFRWGLAAQVFTSLLALSTFIGEVKRFGLEKLRVKRRFGLLFLRWFCVIGVALSPIAPLLGHYGALILVAIYAGVTVYAELAPSRFLAHFNYKDDDEATGKGAQRPRGGDGHLYGTVAPGAVDRETILRSQQRHKRRHGKR